MEKKEIKKPLSRGRADVPVVIQMEALECGAASLTMVMAYYEKWVPLEQVRKDCGVSRDGASAKNILKAARSYGFEAQGFRTELEHLKENGEYPCIIHWNFNHFVVLDGFGRNCAYLNDPARGTVEVPMEEFDRSYTGICLKIHPGEGFEPSGAPKNTLEMARKRLKGAGKAVAFVAATAIIGYLFGIINPVFSRFFMDRLLTGENRELLRPFILLLAGVGILQIMTEALNAFYSNRINAKMDAAGSGAFQWKLLRLPMEFFSQRMAGDLLQRQETNATIAGTLIHTLAPMALNVVMLVFYLLVMLRYSPLLTLIGLGALVLNLFVSQVVSQKRQNITRMQARDLEKLNSTALSGIQMIETIKSSGAENGFFQKWAGYQAAVNAQNVRFAGLNAWLGAVPGILSSLANAAVLATGVWLTMRGEFTVGMILAFQGFLTSFMAPAEELISAGQTILEMRTQMERVDDVMDYPDDPLFADSALLEDKEYRKLSGGVEMKDVTFGYSRLSPPVIENFSMKLEPGKSVAFIGFSGCGKSTLAKLISGLYMPWSGEILFDGKPITAIDRGEFTASVAMVDQDIVLFEGTIADNIRMWDETIEDYDVILAARDAQIHNDIVARENGYQNVLTEGGRNLSGGQRQRIEIARVLALNPTLIIMDEATSALDARTESELMKAIRDRGIACIMIAHRLSTIRDCDEIVVLDHGRVVERGTHEELYARGGAYKTLISNQ